MSNKMTLFTIFLSFSLISTYVDARHDHTFSYMYVVRYPSTQTSREILLSKCQFYFIETLMKQSDSEDSISVGMKFPNGTYERPIQRAHLFWVRPSKYLYVNLTNQDWICDSSIASSFIILKEHLSFDIKLIFTRQVPLWCNYIRHNL